PGEEVHAREPGPLAVRVEELVRLLGLNEAAPERRGELREPEIPLQAVLVAAETFEADDAKRPGAEAALAPEPCDDRGGRLSLQPLQVERAAQADECAGAPRAEAVPGDLGRREAREVGSARSGVQVSM